MIATIVLIGIGLIIALGGVILLDRQRFDRSPRNVYRAATVAGVVIAAMGLFL
ncbi:MAG: hypothetical protein Q4E12_02470 [Coriobacteriia bacterium]|nr:hypothetical protein [Coriobacteriia bacterium]